MTVYKKLKTPSSSQLRNRDSHSARGAGIGGQRYFERAVDKAMGTGGCPRSRCEDDIFELEDGEVFIF